MGNARTVGSGFVRKPMHGPAVDNELPIGAGAVHFFNKRAHVRHRDMRIKSTVADEYLCLNRPRLSWPRCVQTSVYANHSRVVLTAPCLFEYGHPPEAVANRCDSAIRPWLECRRIYPGLRPLGRL